MSVVTRTMALAAKKSDNFFGVTNISPKPAPEKLVHSWFQTEDISDNTRTHSIMEVSTSWKILYISSKCLPRCSRLLEGLQQGIWWQANSVYWHRAPALTMLTWFEKLLSKFSVGSTRIGVNGQRPENSSHFIYTTQQRPLPVSWFKAMTPWNGRRRSLTGCGAWGLNYESGLR